MLAITLFFYFRQEVLFMLELILSFLGAFTGAFVALFLLLKDKPIKVAKRTLHVPNSRFLEKTTTAGGRRQNSVAASESSSDLAARKKEWLYGISKGGDG